MPLTLKDLTTPPSEDELLQQFLAIAQLAGLPVTQWQVGGVARTIAKLVAKGLVSLALLVSKIAAGGLNSTSTGDWQTLLSREVYQNERVDATFAEGTAVLALSSALAGPYTIVAGQLWFTWGTRRYRNTTGGSLSFGSPLTISFRAESPGAGYNAPDNGLSLLTPLAGASVTGSSVTTQGTDAESDKSLRARNADKWGSVGSAANASGYAYWARSASAQVTRVRVREHYPTPGEVSIFIAGPSGGVDAGVVTAVDEYINGDGTADEIVRRPQCVTVLVASSAEQAVPVTGAIRVKVGTANAAAIFARCNELVTSYMGGIDEGGTVFFGDLIALLEGVDGVQNTLLSAPSADVTVAAGSIPVPTLGLVLVFV